MSEGQVRDMKGPAAFMRSRLLAAIVADNLVNLDDDVLGNPGNFFNLLFLVVRCPDSHLVLRGHSWQE